MGIGDEQGLRERSGYMGCKERSHRLMGCRERNLKFNGMQGKEP